MTFLVLFGTHAQVEGNLVVLYPAGSTVANSVDLNVLFPDKFTRLT